MPRNVKGKGKRASNKASPPVTTPEEDVSDNVSVISNQTQESGGTEDEEFTAEEKYEEKIRTAMELALSKAASSRVNALKALCTGFGKRVLTDFLSGNYQTVGDLIERGLKRGKGAEQAAAAKLSSVLIVNLGNTAEGEEMLKTWRPLLAVLMLDPSASLLARQECASALAFSTFVASAEMVEVNSVMNQLQTVFAASFPKGNGVMPVHPSEVCALHAAALLGWALLLCLQASDTVYAIADKLISSVAHLLKSSDLGLRIAAGEVIALLYEGARDWNEDFGWRGEGDLCVKLKELATDSHKYRSKKERKQQRSSFRDVLRAVEEGEAPTESYTFGAKGHKESLQVDSWTTQRQYDVLCSILGIGLNAHLVENAMVRTMFNLGRSPVTQSQKKKERVLAAEAASKARALVRGKSRDNRAATLAYDD